MTKKCSICKLTKPIEKFNKRMNYNKTDTIYRFNFCTACGVKKVQQWQRKNRDRYREYQREYQKNRRSL